MAGDDDLDAMARLAASSDDEGAGGGGVAAAAAAPPPAAGLPPAATPRDNDKRAENCKVARAVRRALARRRDDDAAGDGDDEPSSLPSKTFTHLASNDNDIKYVDVVKAVFLKKRTMYSTLVADGLGVSIDKLNWVRATTLFRYILHRQAAWNALLRSSQPLSWFVGSLRVKWDETQQEVGIKAEGQRLGSKPSVMVISMFVKLAGMPWPLPWFVPSRRIARTTADCLWSSLESAPFGPFSKERFKPVDTQFVKWLWLIMCADDASSNNRPSRSKRGTPANRQLRWVLTFVFWLENSRGYQIVHASRIPTSFLLASAGAISRVPVLKKNPHQPILKQPL